MCQVDLVLWLMDIEKQLGMYSYNYTKLHIDIKNCLDAKPFFLWEAGANVELRRLSSVFVGSGGLEEPICEALMMEIM